MIPCLSISSSGMMDPLLYGVFSATSLNIIIYTINLSILIQCL
jgi:hypothetical protein